jgi:hypothetical protein
MKILSNGTTGILSDAVRMRLQGVDSMTKLRLNEYLRRTVAPNTARVEITREDGSRLVTVLRNADKPADALESAVERRLRDGGGTYDRNGTKQSLPSGMIVNRRG